MLTSLPGTAGSTGIKDSPATSPPPNPPPQPPAPRQTFTLGAAQFMYSPAQVSNGKEAQAACRAWRASALTIWWESWAELGAVANLIKPATGVALVATDLYCRSSGSGGSDVLPNMVLDADVTCFRQSSGQAVPPQLLAWYTLGSSADGGDLAFEALLLLQPTSSTSRPNGLLGGSSRRQNSLLCRDGTGEATAALLGTRLPVAGAAACT
jgi:hypothetical protein